MVFPFELEVFCLSKVICYQKEVQIRRGNGELSLWIVCISATLAFVMEYIKVVILQSPHSMSALRQAL